MANQNDLDIWNYILYTTELALTILTFPVNFYFWYLLKTKTSLHINFRTILFWCNFAICMTGLYRVYVIFIRLFFIGNDPTSYLVKFPLPSFMFFSTLETFSFAIASIERVFATIFATKYEKYADEYIIPTFLTFFLLIYALTLTLIACFDLVFSVGNIYIFMSFYELVIAILQGITIIVILMFNKRAYKNRHTQRVQLSGRYQIQENIETNAYILPVAFVSLLKKLLYSCLLIYSMLHTSANLGTDTSHLSHLYDIPYCLTRLLEVSWLVYKGRNIVVYRNPIEKRSTQDSVVEETKRHFKSLQSMWA